MVKKRIAIIFLFLVNIVLLAHIIIPHHHHDGAICITHSQCNEHDVENTHNCLASEHNHSQNHDKKSGDCCLLKEPVPITRTIISFRNDVQVKKECHFFNLVAILQNDLPEPHFFNLPFHYTEYCFSGYSLTPAGIISLRGPPTA
ncbi:MAG: hypothetical protein K0B15_01085 [Lentimicrobium sp.]|nr:hypothetical protein [Lentimicrobium sp.]